jgi:hypothetical protein
VGVDGEELRGVGREAGACGSAGGWRSGVSLLLTVLPSKPTPLGEPLRGAAAPCWYRCSRRESGRRAADESRSSHPASAAISARLMPASNSNWRDERVSGLGDCRNADSKGDAS